MGRYDHTHPQPEQPPFRRDVFPIRSAWSVAGRVPETVGWWLLLLHLVLSPVAFCRNTVEAFESCKVAVLCLVAIVLAALALSGGVGRVLRLSEEQWWRTSCREAWRSLWREPIALGMVLFLVSAIASTVTSLSPRTSFQGAHESYAGLCTVAGYTILFFATRTWGATRDGFRCLLGASVLGTACTCAYAVVQVAQLDPIPWDNGARFGAYLRPGSTLGHPNFLAAYLVMTFPITAYYAWEAARQRQRLALVVLVLVGSLACLGILLSLSRGAWLAFAGTTVLLVLGWLPPGRRCRWSVLVLLAGVVLLAGLGILLASQAVPGRSVLLESLAERLRHLGDAASRRHIWRAGLEIFRDHPVFGCGLDTFQLAFEPKRTVEYWQSEWGATPAKAHNEAIHILATQGLLGALAVVILTGGLVVSGARAWRQSSPEGKRWLVAISAGIVGFYLQNLFSFTVAGCGTLFVTFAAVLSRLGAPEAGSEPGATGACYPGFKNALFMANLLATLVFADNFWRGQAPVALGALPGCLWILLFPILAALGVMRLELVERSLPQAGGGRTRPACADRERGGPAIFPWQRRTVQLGIWAGAITLAVLGILRPMQASWICHTGDRSLEENPHQALVRYERALTLDPGNELYWQKLGAAAMLGAAQAPEKAQRGQLLAHARQALERAVELVPGNLYNRVSLGQVLGQLAREGLASPAEAFVQFDAALAADPANAYFYTEAGHAALVLGDTARTGLYALTALKLYPGLAPALAQLGYLAILHEQLPEAVNWLGTALHADWHGDDDSHLMAASALAVTLGRLQRLEEAVKVARSVLARKPDWVETHFTLAKSLALLGRRDEAIMEYRLLLVRHPGYLQAREELRRLDAAPAVTQTLSRP